MRYAVVIEKAPANYAAYVPDLPGCIATGETVAETESLIREAIEFHLEGLKADGFPIPPPSSQVDYVDIPASGVLLRAAARISPPERLRLKVVRRTGTS